MSESSAFNAAESWALLRSTADQMSAATDDVIYDAHKAIFDRLVAELKGRNEPIPPDILANPLLKTQFLPKSASLGEPTMDAMPTGEVELFGKKVMAPVIATPAEALEAPAEPIEYAPPTPEQLAAIDNLIRQAKVAQMRNDRAGATDLLAQAEAIAPHASTVLEALGDEMASARKFGEARRYYERARKADPENLSADKKFADLVFRTDASRHIYTHSDDAEIMADPKKAAMLSYLAPGLGQLVTGSPVKGAILLAAFLTTSLGAVKLGLMSGLTQLAGGKIPVGDPTKAPVQASPFAYVLAFAGLIVYIVNVADIVSRAKAGGKRASNRPVPPENLPFD